MIKEALKEEDITLVNIYAPNIGVPKYIKQILTDIKGEVDKNTIVGDFNTPWHQRTDLPDRKSISNRDPKWHNKTVGHNWYLQDNIYQKQTNKQKQKTKTPNAHSFQACMEHSLG